MFVVGKGTQPGQDVWAVFREVYCQDGPSPLRVTRTGSPELCRDRKLTYLVNAGGGRNFGVHNQNLATVTRGLLERVFLHQVDGVFEAPYVPEREHFFQQLQPFMARIRERCFRVTPLSREEFVETRDSRTRRLYENALVELELYGLEEKDAWLQTFVKFEKLDFTKKPDPAPRVIQPRSPKFNIELGKYIHPLEPRLFKVLSRIFMHRTVFKGINALQSGLLMEEKWSHFRNPVAFGLDAKRFDQHVHEYALEWEHLVYQLFFPGDRELPELLRQQIYQTGRAYCADGKIKYQTVGKRSSGDMNTGLGNCVLMCAMVYSFLHSVGLGPDEFRLANNGDDCVIIVDQTNSDLLQRLPQWFEQMGFPVELEPPVFILEHVEFCQTHPVFDGFNWVLTRDPRVCLTKDVCTTKPVNSVADWNTLRNTVGMSGLALAGNLPVFCEFYEFLRRGAGSRIDKDLSMTGFKFLARGMNHSKLPVTDAGRVSFWLAFGITPDEQCALEAAYRALVPQYELPTCWVEVHSHPSMGSVC